MIGDGPKVKLKEIQVVVTYRNHSMKVLISEEALRESVLKPPTFLGMVAWEALKKCWFEL